MKKVKINRLYKGLIDIRDYIAKNSFEKDESIEVSVIDLTDKMILTPKDLKNNVISISKEFKSKLKNGKSYKLLSYKWNPNV